MAGNRENLIAAWRAIDNDADLSAIDRYFAPDFVRHGGKSWGRDQFKKLMTDLRTGFPDLRQVAFETVAEGDQVAYRWESEGTHTGPYMGSPPTGRVVRARGVTISRFNAEGLIVEDWTSWNELSVLHDLGILPIDRR